MKLHVLQVVDWNAIQMDIIVQLGSTLEAVCILVELATMNAMMIAAGILMA